MMAVVTAAAAVTVGAYLFREARSVAAEPPPPLSLHRSNAVRRPRRRSRGRNRRESGASASSSSESHTDENIDIHTLPMQTDGADTVGNETLDDNWWDDPSQLPLQRAGQNIVGLLFRVSEDNARRNAYVHRGCGCNACGILPIRGIRYRCANCADFDLCETCESQGLHIKTHIFYKIKVPAPPSGPRQMQPTWYPGDPDTCIRNLPKGIMNKLSKETGFERPELEAFWEQWTFMANTEWREDPDDLCLAMDRKTFERCLVPSGGYRHTAPNLIHDRMFAFYDANNDDLIGFSEFLQGLSFRKKKNKLRKVFDGYDVDKDGFVNRRDFLRLFRAYYVLYKQMHRDILESLDEQVLNSTEAQQAVSSRQPLSSFFGREGPIPRADLGRITTEGKLFRDDGDVMVSGGGTIPVVDEDQPDTANRKDILTSLFTRTSPRSRMLAGNSYSPDPSGPPFPEVDGVDENYWDALLNPPSTVEELPQLLIGNSRTRVLDEIFASNGDEEQENGRDAEDGAHSSDDLPNGDPPVSSLEADADGQVNGTTPESENRLERHVANEPWSARAPTESELRVRHQQIMANNRRRSAMDRSARVAARKKLHERWKRRQFYLDEEEGGLPPDGWQDEEDVLVHANGAAETSKSAQAHILSPRSRSSSKVRFAEDTDDYEIRSNPSTSSRSVPERWGGMDIPDAERDAGREILYQVTQQAFNELLDVLFESKEDLAVRAAETVDSRDKHRALFESIDLAEEDKLETASSSDLDTSKAISGQNLPELLATSYYTVDDSGAVLVHNGDAAGDDDDGPSGLTRPNEPRDPEIRPAAVFAPSDPTRAVAHRDPTMPQFRPNSQADTTVTAAAADLSSVEPGWEWGTSQPRRTSPLPMSSPRRSGQDQGQGQSRARGAKSPSGERGAAATTIPRATLVEWKRLDAAEREAQERGGWGKLSFDEFEAIYRAEEVRSNRLDYLGSWIDFCIP